MLSLREFIYCYFNKGANVVFVSMVVICSLKRI